MDFYEVLDKVVDLLRHRQRVSYRALKRQFQLDDAFLEDLKVEIMRVQQLAIDQDGEMLVWRGDAGGVSARVPSLITVGRYDEMTPTCAETMHRRMPHAQMQVFEQSSHTAHVEEPERYLQVVAEFLSHVEAGHEHHEGEGW